MVQVWLSTRLVPCSFIDHATGSTRFPTESPRTPLRSLVRLRTRGTLPRSSMSAMKPGAALSPERPRQRPPPMTFPCTYNQYLVSYTISKLFCSRNITIQNSPAFTRRDDPAYTSIPQDSKKAPAPIDPSGTSIRIPPTMRC
jgi:hypothetical protein